MSFINALRDAGWVEVKESINYRKGSWQLTFDTSSWIEVGTERTPRIFDVPIPEPHLFQWSLNLIEHLCKTDDRLTQKNPQ